MLQVPYLLVQEDKSGVYTIFRNGFFDVVPESKVQALLDAASNRVCAHIEGLSQSLILDAYTVCYITRIPDNLLLLTFI